MTKPIKQPVKVVTLVSLLLLTLVLLSTSTVYAAVSVKIFQCANDSDGSDTMCRGSGNIGWISGNVGDNKANYVEGDFLPYRQIITGLTAGYEYCAGFGWDVSKGGLPAIDYISTYNLSTPADPVWNTSLAGSSPTDTLAIPPDPVLSGFMDDGAGPYTFNGNQQSGVITLWGGTFTTTTPPYLNTTGGDLDVATVQATEYCFIATGPDAVVAWAGHIANHFEWGAPTKPTGSPYHTFNNTQGLVTPPRTGGNQISCEAPDGTISNSTMGNQELQLSAGAIDDTTIAYNAGKTSIITTDVDPVSAPNISPGDILQYIISTTSLGTADVDNVVILDTVPTHTAYLPNTAYYSDTCAAPWTAIPDAPNPTTPFPFDEGGFAIPDLLYEPGDTYCVRFDVEVSDSADFSQGVTFVENCVLLTSSNATDRQSCDVRDVDETTPVTLAYVSAERNGKTVDIHWQTATETGTAGFRLLGIAPDGTVTPFSNSMTTATGVATVVPQEYRVQLPSWSSNAFYLEDIGIRGEVTRHGPFTIGKSDGHLVAPVAIDWLAIEAEHAALAETRSATAVAAAQPAFQPGLESNLNSGGINVLVTDSGLQRITYADLVALGIQPDGLRTNKIALLSQGQPVPITIYGGNRVGPDTIIEFIGEALDTLYTHTNVYTLVVDGSGAIRIPLDRGQVPADAPVTAYQTTVTVEEDKLYNFLAPNGDPWIAVEMTAQGADYSQDFPLFVDNVADETDPVLHVNVWGLTDWQVEGDDHRLQISLNGALVSDTTFDGLTNHPLSITLPTGLLQEGANTLNLTVPKPTTPGIWWDMINLDSYGVTYPRAFVATNNALTFTASGAAFEVNGLTSLDGAVYRITDAGAERLIRAIGAANDDGTYRVKFRGSAEEATYHVVASNAAFSPELAAMQPFTDITTGNADYIMIAHPSFIDGIAPLVAFHEANGVTVKVVDVADIYAQFGYGMLDPLAIQAYIAHAVNNMGTQYVLLVGGDSYDYFDNLGLGSMSFIPSLYGPTAPYVTFAPLDPLFADVNGDQLPDVPLGRLPVRTTDELTNIISKTLTYASGTGQSMLMAADAGFSGISNNFVDALPYGWGVTTAYLDSDDVATAKQAIIDAIDGGVRLTSFLGHSGPASWTFSGLFMASDAAALTNTTPTVVNQWGCWNTYHVEPEYNTMAHEFMLNDGSGAAAVLGATTITQVSSDAVLGVQMLPNILQPGQSIGWGMQLAKDSVAFTHPDMSDVLLGWTILGDPALQIQQQAEN